MRGRKRTTILDFVYPNVGRYAAAEAAYHLRRCFATLPDGWKFSLYPATGCVLWELKTPIGKVVREGLYDLHTTRIKHWVVNNYK